MNLAIQSSLRYGSIWALGSLAIIMAVPFIRSSRIQGDIDSARQLLETGRPAEALSILQSVEPWAAPHPSLLLRLTCITVQCHVRLFDVGAAERVAAAFADTASAPRQAASGIPGFLQRPSITVVNNSLGLPSEGDRWAAYETLVNELRKDTGIAHLERVATAIVSRDPANPLGRKTLEYVARRKQEEDRRLVAATPTDPSPAPGSSPEPTKPTKKRVDHCELAKKYLDAKNWNKALEQCELALAFDPKDSRALSLKKQAEIRDTRWGYTHTLAKVYDASGKFLQNVDPATLVEVSATKNSPSVGDLAICTVFAADKQFTGLLIRLKDLDLKPGLVAMASPEEKEVRQKRALLLDEIRKARDEQQKALLANNPFAKEYEAANAAYKAYWANVKDLTAKRDAATGEQRDKFIDELRMLKGEDIRVGQALEAVEKKIAGWKQENSASIPANPRVQALEAELTGLQGRLNPPRQEPESASAGAE